MRFLRKSGKSPAQSGVLPVLLHLCALISRQSNAGMYCRLYTGGLVLRTGEEMPGEEGRQTVSHVLTLWDTGIISCIGFCLTGILEKGGNL